VSAVTSASVATTSASRYLQQLCKHWAHKLVVEFDATAGNVRFPNGGVLQMLAATDALQVTITATDAETAVTLQGVVARHLDRFAFREAPLGFAWSVPAAAL
jgi:hypothetical protein